MLHLKGMLAPKNQLASIPRAAMQMQREVLWYKEIEKLIPFAHKKKTNSEDKTPYEVFLAEHKGLRKEAGKQMKQVANSSILVAILIATIAFTTTFAVPSGYNSSTGVPILENERLFLIFPVSEVAAMLSSLISLLMFLWILTSRYSDQDFLKPLPFALVIGMASIFVGIIAMMVLFCTCILYFWHESTITAVVVALFALVPIIFVVLTYPILFTLLHYTCSYK